MSQRDELTKLGNRRMMVHEYNEIIVPVIKNGDSAFLVMIDLDDFKPVNDTYGHSYGDQVLRNISEIFLQNRTKEMMVYRMGGDEFAFMFIHSAKDDVINKIKDIQHLVANYEYEKPVSISFSAGSLSSWSTSSQLQSLSFSTSSGSIAIQTAILPTFSTATYF